MIAAYVTAMRRYATFRGRSPREELWWFKLVMVVLCLAALRVDGFVFGGSDDEQAPLLCLAFLAHLLPSVAVDVRRLHDTDRSGWWALVGLIPLVGPVVLLVWFCQPGVSGPNRFGADPLEGATSAVGSPHRSRHVGTDQPSKVASHDVVGDVERAARLRASGTLSEGEFESLKTRILFGAEGV